MRTNLTQAQVTAIIEEYFEERDAVVNFCYYGIGDDGQFSGCLIDHDVEVELPEG
jgi:hypothetical protein